MNLKNQWIAALLCASMGTGYIQAQDATSQAGAPAVQETEQQKEKRMDWFAHAKLGVFIHWGIYAVDGVSESWSFFNNYLPYEEYMKQAEGFTAAHYDPKQWVQLIKESGASYTVITTKHHDGVALWDTKAGSLSTVKSTPAGRDLVEPFVKEVRKQGLKLGFYYSLLDWSHPDYPNKTRTETRYKDDPQRWKKFVDFNADYIIAYGELDKSLVSPTSAMSSYQPFTINILYRDLTRKPKYILIVCSSSKYGDYFTGSTSSVLLLDEFDLIYGEPQVDTRYIHN